MTDAEDIHPRRETYSQASGDEAKLMPLAVHGLHLAFFATGFTPIIAVIIAYLGRREAEDWRTSHYEFAIWTFWLALAGSGVGWTLIVIGIPMLLALGLGIIPIVIGGAVLALVSIWFAVRAVMGIVYALRGEPYPRPRALLV